MTGPEPATPAEAGPGRAATPFLRPTPFLRATRFRRSSRHPVPTRYPRRPPPRVPGRCATSSTPRPRPRWPSCWPPARTAPPGLADPDAATAPKTWADTVRASVRRAVGTALAEAVTPDEPVQPVEPVGDRAGRAAVRRRHHVGGARLRAHLHPRDRPEPALVRVLVEAPGGDRAAPSALADLKGRPGRPATVPRWPTGSGSISTRSTRCCSARTAVRGLHAGPAHRADAAAGDGPAGGLLDHELTWRQ